MSKSYFCLKDTTSVLGSFKEINWTNSLRCLRCDCSAYEFTFVSLALVQGPWTSSVVHKTDSQRPWITITELAFCISYLIITRDFMADNPGKNIHRVRQVTFHDGVFQTVRLKLSWVCFSLNCKLLFLIITIQREMTNLFHVKWYIYFVKTLSQAGQLRTNRSFFRCKFPWNCAQPSARRPGRGTYCTPLIREPLALPESLPPVSVTMLAIWMLYHMYTRVQCSHFASWIFRSSVNHLHILHTCGQGKNVWVCSLAVSDSEFFIAE